MTAIDGAITLRGHVMAIHEKHAQVGLRAEQCGQGLQMETAVHEQLRAGQLRGNLHAAEARREQALIQYQQTIQQAFRDVDDALVFRAKASDIRTHQETRVQAAGRALDIANRRYTNGLGTYLDVLDAQRQLFAAEIDLTGITRDQLTAVVQVYKALGGGWEVKE